MGVGSESQKVAQTIGSILTGLVTGNAGQAVAGGNAAAGAGGAFSGELATRYIAGKYWGQIRRRKSPPLIRTTADS